MIDSKQAEAELRNWGLCMHDGWLQHHLGFRPPQTSEEYVAPAVAFDEPEQAREPINELDAQMTTDIVVLIGMDHIDSYRVLVRWYCHILVAPSTTHEESIKNLSKFMHCNYRAATRMLEDAVNRYRLYRASPKQQVGRAS